VIVGEKNLAQGKVEIKNRKTGERSFVEKDKLLEHLKGLAQVHNGGDHA
jgi:prolyl-tRNA synthetase